MANEVFANTREISCKSGDGKSICAFPDVCFTPPENPTTPPGVPIPYPNTGMATDTTSGSKKVKISGKEVMLKNKSYFQKSTGDEAGCAAKKGVLTSTNRGKVYFTSWSMDVKIEGANVVRHMDLTTHNHMCGPGNTPPWMHVDAMAFADIEDCSGDKEKIEKACDKFTPKGTRDACEEAGLGEKKINSNAAAQTRGFANLAEWKESITKSAQADTDATKCVNARRCQLTPYEPNNCCPAQTADHVIPKASFTKASGWKNYKKNKAPCMCAEGTSNVGGSHGLRHSVHKLKGKQAGLRDGQKVSFEDELKRSAASANETFKSSGCDPKCIEQQLREGHKGMGSGEINHSPCGTQMDQAAIDAKMADYSSATPTR